MLLDWQKQIYEHLKGEDFEILSIQKEEITVSTELKLNQALEILEPFHIKSTFQVQREFENGDLSFSHWKFLIEK